MRFGLRDLKSLVIAICDLEHLAKQTNQGALRVIDLRGPGAREGGHTL